MGTRGLFQLGVVCLLALAVIGAAGPTMAGAPEVTLRAGHDQPLRSMYDEGHQYLARRLAEQTNGRIQVQVFPAAQLGSEPVMIEGVRMGSIDIVVAHVANFATVVPELALFSVSYLFKDQAHLERLIDDPKFHARFSEIVEAKNLGLRIIGYYTAGVRSLYNRKVAVRTPDDLKGLKIRVMANPIEAKIWSTFGGIPTSMPTSEVYSALQAGIVDGGENCPSVVENFKYNEAAPYLVMTEHQHSIAPLIMSDRRFKSMPADLQRTLLEVAREASLHQRKRDAALNMEALERMKAKGARIIEPDKSKFAALAAPIQEEVAKNFKLEDVLAMVRAAAK